jgi:hypothetical protein
LSLATGNDCARQHGGSGHPPQLCPWSVFRARPNGPAPGGRSSQHRSRCRQWTPCRLDFRAAAAPCDSLHSPCRPEGPRKVSASSLSGAGLVRRAQQRVPGGPLARCPRLFRSLQSASPRPLRQIGLGAAGPPCRRHPPAGRGPVAVSGGPGTTIGSSRRVASLPAAQPSVIPPQTERRSMVNARRTVR